MIDTIRNAHSAAGMTSGCFLYNRNRVSAAFFLTKLCDVLFDLLIIVGLTDQSITYGEMSKR